VAFLNFTEMSITTGLCPIGLDLARVIAGLGGVGNRPVLDSQLFRPIASAGSLVCPHVAYQRHYLPD
jgi:hypothetical protein